MAEHGFKAEVQQLLELMIHSVYSDREVFLRELVSNAADAIDKARFLSLTRPELRPGAADGPAVRIRVDAEARIVSVEDDGIGMTHAEAVDNLGTIARSGTRAFLQAAQDGAPRLIGQFGLGFYASFMVADRVEVDTLSAEPDAPAVRWISDGKGSFDVTEGTRSTRGTTVTLHLRDDAGEFAEASRIQAIVRKHSNFLAWPVFVGEAQANVAKALWAEPPSQVSEEDATAFYKGLAFDWRAPAARIHVSVDSPIQVRALLFVPEDRPFDLYTPDAPRGPRLYTRRVLIEDHARTLLPDWLRFVRGVVECDDIPLNVSREMVQNTPLVRKLHDILTKRVLAQLEKHAAAPAEGPDAPRVPWSTVWTAFGPLLKEGVWHEHGDIRDQLLPLLRFHTTACEQPEGLRSLAEIKAGRKEGQEHMWFVTAPSREAALSSPHLEAFRRRGWEVILLTDAVDEWFAQALTEFDGVSLRNAGRGDLDLPEAATEGEADLGAFAGWAKGVLGDIVADVRRSNRLTDSPAVLVDTEDGMSANMQRILRQANQQVPPSRRVLELNASHGLVRNVMGLVEQGKAGDAEELLRLMLDNALLLEGGAVDAPSLGRRLQGLLLRASEAALRG